MRQYPGTTEVTAKQLRMRFFLYLAAALLTLMVGIAITISVTFIGSLKKAEAQNLAHIAEVRSIAISEWCRHVKNIAQQITSRTRIRQELERYNKGKITLQQIEFFTQPKLTDAMNLSDEIIGILRLDGKDQIVTRCGYGASLPLGHQDIIGFVSESVTISKPLVIKDIPSIIVSAPIIDRTGERQGTDLVIFDLQLLKNIITNPKNLGKTNEIILGYETDHQVLPLFSRNDQRDYSVITSDSFQVVQGFVEKAIYGKSGLHYAADMAVVYYPVEEANWGLVITQNENELYASLHRKITLIGAFACVLYTIILFGFWLIMKPMAGRILLHTDELKTKIREKTENLEREILERKKAEQGKEKIIVDLRVAMREIKTLSGMLPICSNCKKIRDDDGYWSQIESYIKEHSDAEFTHGLCPACAKELYPDFDLQSE